MEAPVVEEGAAAPAATEEAKKEEAKEEEEVAVSWRTLYSAMASRNSPSRMCNMVMPVDRILQSE